MSGLSVDREMPDDFALSVCMRDTRAKGVQARGVEAAYVVSVLATGPVRVFYAVESVKDRPGKEVIFTNRAPLTDEDRARVWGRVLESGVMLRERRDLADSDQARPWIRLHAWGVSWCLSLDADGSIGGWPVAEDLAALLPGAAWRSLHKRLFCWLEDLGVFRTARPLEAVPAPAVLVEPKDLAAWDAADAETEIGAGDAV
jgi:hypothetical protein